MPLTPEEQRELDELEFEKLSAEKIASTTPVPAVEADVEVVDGVVPTEQLSPKAQALKEIGWDNLGAMERMELLARAAPEYAKKELLGVGKQTGGFAARAAGPAVGQLAGRATRIPLVDRLLGSVGGAIGEFAGQQIEDEPFSPGRILGAAFAGGVTGKPLANATVRQVGTESAKYAATNLGAKALETGIDEGRLPNLSEVEESAIGGVAGALAGKALDRGRQSASALSTAAKNAPADKVVGEARKAGYVFLPSKMGNSGMADVADYLGGASPNSSALVNLATLRNQVVTDDLARAYVKAPKDMPLDEAHIAMLFNAAEEPYRKVAAVSPQAAASLEMFKQAKSDAKKAWRAYDRQPSPELKKFAGENDELADLAMDDMIAEAQSAGKPQLIPALEKARVELAKLHLLDRSMNYGSFNASAKTFADAFENKAPLTDEADLIARMYLAFPGIMRDASKVATVGSGKLPIVSKVVRDITLSNPSQRAIQSGRAADRGAQDTAAVAARSGVMAEARDDED